MITIKDFLKTFGITTTTNFDLISIANFLNLEIKVVMKNELEDLVINNKKDLKLIINYQNENQRGTHWVAYRGSLKAPQAKLPQDKMKDNYYFDSFGLKPLEKLEPFVKKYNQEQLQHYETNICGQLCLYFLYSLEKGIEFESIISEFKDLYLELDSLN